MNSQTNTLAVRDAKSGSLNLKRFSMRKNKEVMGFLVIKLGAWLVVALFALSLIYIGMHGVGRLSAEFLTSFPKK